MDEEDSRLAGLIRPSLAQDGRAYVLTVWRLETPFMEFLRQAESMGDLKIQTFGQELALLTITRRQPPPPLPSHP